MMPSTEMAAPSAAMPRQRYARANEWPSDLPALTPIEAERAVRRLFQKFAGRPPGSKRVRRCWVPQKPPFNTLHRGWRRLAHDVSHRIHRLRHPDRPPHDPRHEFLEAEIAEHIVKSGWLAGALKPKAKPAPTPEQGLLAKHDRIAVRLAGWQRKAKRAATAIKKLERQRRYYERAISARLA